MKKDLLTLADLDPETLIALLDKADELKAETRRGKYYPYLTGKTLGMIFAKSSTRTRVSFETGMYQLGGHALFLSSREIQLGRGETIADTARVLSRYLDAIMIRNDSHSETVELAKWSSVPVINGLSDRFHPCQILADLQTIREKKGTLTGLKLAYVGDGNNVAHSLMIGGALAKMNIAVASPAEYEVDRMVVRQAADLARRSGSELLLTSNPAEAVADADVVYTDTWVSMGQEELKREKVPVFKDFQVNRELMSLAKADAIFMHCLPAYRGYEVSEEVFEGPQSVVFDEAENRLHAQKAALIYTILGEL